jgi:cAMP-dependent protein kinase regulator
MKRNEKYMKMLANVPILETIDYYERSKILDACRCVEFDEDESVINEGDPATEFYILIEGEAYATKCFDNQDGPVKVKDYSPGDYFGERALLKNEMRAASIIAKTNIKCLALDRSSFIKLLGPIEHILKRNMKIYINYIDQ